LPLTLENALYSREGRWGVLISHEMHALIAGSEGFMNALTKQYPGWTNDVQLLREAWAGNPNGEWLEAIVNRAVKV